MPDPIHFAAPSATDAQLFVLARLIHLREQNWGDPGLPAWVIELPLRAEPYEMAADRVGRCIAGLVDAGLVVRTELEPEGGGEAETHYHASDAAKEASEAIAAELRCRHPDLPVELGALLVIHDANESPEGFDRDLLEHCLEHPPASLEVDAAAKVYQSLLKQAWIFHSRHSDAPGRWYPSAKCWAWTEGIEAALAARLDEQRQGMVDGVMRLLKIPIDSPLHAALRAVDRADFVAQSMRHLAYRKRPLPVGMDEHGKGGTTTSSPDVCATIVQALAPKAGDQVLVCGVKGGFTAALCAAIVGPSGRVECLETDGAIAEHARASLDRAGFDERRVRVHVVKDVTIGRDAPQRWDVAVVNGKIPKVPRSIIKQMADGGRLLIFLQDGEERGQTAYLIQMDGKAIKNTALSSFVFTPIYGEFGFDPPNWQENLQLVGASTHDAFISFSSRDEVTARAIVDEFERSGVRCWMSCRDLATASHLSTDGYAQAIMSAIREAALFVVLLSHESLESPHVKNELGQATDQKKLMLPIRLEACPPRLPDSFQYHLNRHQTVDLARQPMSEGVRHALALLGWSSPAPVAPAPTGRTIDDPPTDAEPPRSETITIEKSPHEHAEAFRSQLAAAVADGHLTQQELDALCALAMGTGTAKDLQSARSMVIAQARVLAPSVVIDDELSL